MKSNPEDRFTQKNLFDSSPDDVSENIVDTKSSSPNDEIVKSETIDDETLFRLYSSILVLSTLQGVGFRTICKAYDSDFLFDIWTHPDSLTAHPFVTNSAIPSLTDFAKDPKRIVEAASKSLLQEMEHSQITFTAQGHSSYPTPLLKLSEPPRWLFMQGNPDTLHSSSIVAIIGTREASNSGIQLAQNLAASFARQNIVVLSGLARGIDEAAHQGCIDYYGQTIAVLGHGIQYHRLSKDVVSLRNIILARDGTIISEYLPNDPPSRRSYLRRNALQVALSKAVIPVEFPKRQSGTGSTILRAKELKVPLIGFVLRDTEEESLLATRKNFILENIPIYEVHANLDKTIAKTLRNVLSYHHWDPNPQSRQKRFFTVLVGRIMKVKDRIDLDESAIDQLAVMLKRELKKGNADDKGVDL